MKGLLLKEFILVKKTMLKPLITLAIFCIIAILDEDFRGMITTIILIYALLIPITSFSYDEKNNYNRYLLSMSLSRFELVLAKYIFLIILNIIGILSIIIISSFVSDNIFETVKIQYMMFLALSILQFIVFPIIYKFGVEKARFIFYGIGILPVVLTNLFDNYTLRIDLDELLLNFTRISPVILLIGFVLSFVLSYKICKNKEY